MQNDHFRNYTRADGLSSDRIISAHQDRSGRIWTATTAGIDRLDGDRFVPVRWASGASEITYGPLAEDSSGNLYALSPVKGISRIEENRTIRRPRVRRVCDTRAFLDRASRAQ